MQNRIVIIDYGMGNLRSVQKKMIRAGADVIISGNPDVIRAADKLILPGVGHFAHGIKKLHEYKIWDVLNEKVLIDKTPILGICLGMQLMAKYSEEGEINGLGWFDAEVVKFSVGDKLKYKVPHMGWNNAEGHNNHSIFNGIPKEAMYYFVHSYHIHCNDDKDILTTTEYDYLFTSAIQKDNIYGTQFHPEKSHDWGELVFKNFIELSK